MNETLDDIESDDPVTVFEWPHTIWSSPTGYLVLGTACLLLAFVCIELNIRFEQEWAAKSAYGACFTLAASFLYRAWLALRTPHTVITGKHGVVLVYRKRETTHPWTDLAHTEKGESSVSYRPYLILFDANGRRLTKLSGDIEDFDALTEIVQRKIAGSAGVSPAG